MSPRARADLIAWLGGLALGAIGTAVAVAGGARLGAGLTLGVVILALAVILRLAIESASGSKDGP